MCWVGEGRSSGGGGLGDQDVPVGGEGSVANGALSDHVKGPVQGYRGEATEHINAVASDISRCLSLLGSMEGQGGRRCQWTLRLGTEWQTDASEGLQGSNRARSR
jgi:hypothetical protein